MPLAFRSPLPARLATMRRTGACGDAGFTPVRERFGVWCEAGRWSQLTPKFYGSCHDDFVCTLPAQCGCGACVRIGTGLRMGPDAPGADSACVVLSSTGPAMPPSRARQMAPEQRPLEWETASHAAREICGKEFAVGPDSACFPCRLWAPVQRTQAVQQRGAAAAAQQG